MLSTNLCYQYLRILFVHSYNTGKYHLRPCYIKEIQSFLRTEKHADKMKVGGPPEESWLQKRFSGRRGRKNRKMKIYYKTRSFNNRFDTTLWWETQLLLLLFCFVLLWFQIFSFERDYKTIATFLIQSNLSEKFEDLLVITSIVIGHFRETYPYLQPCKSESVFFFVSKSLVINICYLSVKVGPCGEKLSPRS